MLRFWHCGYILFIFVFRKLKNDFWKYRTTLVISVVRCLLNSGFLSHKPNNAFVQTIWLDETTYTVWSRNQLNSSYLCEYEDTKTAERGSPHAHTKKSAWNIITKPDRSMLEKSIKFKFVLQFRYDRKTKASPVFNIVRRGVQNLTCIFII